MSSLRLAYARFASLPEFPLAALWSTNMATSTVRELAYRVQDTNVKGCELVRYVATSSRGSAGKTVDMNKYE